MSYSLRLSRIIAVLFLMFVGIHAVEAQDLPKQSVVQDGRSYFRYRVEPGEGLYAISRTFSLTVAEILRVNPEADKGLLSGQELLIPITKENSAIIEKIVKDAPPSPSASIDSDQSISTDQNRYFKHTVVSGETIYTLSKMYNTTVDEIYRLNPDSADGIMVGQVLIMPQRRFVSEVKEENYRYHTILAKETLYSLSRTYSLKPEDIMRANPGLSVETFQVGKTIRIPFFESNQAVIPFQSQSSEIVHKVKRGETLYSISRQYNVQVVEIQQMNPDTRTGLKVNMELVIPLQSESADASGLLAESDANRILTQRSEHEKVDVMQVGLLLPLLDETGGAHLRLQEYYEGFLMAVDELKDQGANIDLYVFEIGKGDNTKKLETLLETLEMQSLDLVIGGVSDAQIRIISDFSKSHNIKYVVPFSQSNGEVLNNGNIFQVNPLHKSLIDTASDLFTDTFSNANIIFVSGGQNEKMDFLSLLQNRLRTQNIRYETISSTSTLNLSIRSLLRSGKENIIIPTSGDSNTLRHIIEELRRVQEADSNFTIRLFGYPEWQTYSDLISQYHQFGTYIYTPFFVDEASPATKKFREDFRKWYDKGLMETNPGYAMWGYDTGLFFLTALQRYGRNFEQNMGEVKVKSLQFPFQFERLNNWGGFFNRGYFCVYYDPNGKIIKIDRSL